MQLTNLTNLKKVFEHYWKLKHPLALWGKPSTGKTSMFRQFAQKKAEELKLKYSEDEYGPEFFTFKTIIPSQFDPVDFIGMMKEKDGITYFNPVSSFPRTGQGIFFIDEVSNADHTIIAPLQRLMLEGRLENYKMPSTFWRVCAGNRSQDLCQTNELSLAFYRRVAHYDVEPTNDEVLTYFLEQGRDPRVIAYLRRFQEDLFPKKLDESLLETKANPFPYTWEMSSQIINGIKELHLIQDLVGSWVGPECASRFCAFCKTTEKVNIEKIIAHPKESLLVLDKDPERPSLYFAIVSILATMWQSKNEKLKPEKVVELMLLFPPEFATFFLTLVIKNPARRVQLTKQPSFDQLLLKLGYFLDED